MKIDGSLFDTDSAGYSPGDDLDGSQYLIAELSYDSGVSIVGRRFVGGERGAATAAALNALAARHGIEPREHLPAPPVAREARARVRLGSLAPLPKRERSSFARAGFVQLCARDRRSLRAFLRALARSPAIWKAGLAPVPRLAGAAIRPPDSGISGTLNFEPVQGYLHGAPSGIGAPYAWAEKGGAGRGVRVCDVEANWDTGHKDLPRGIKRVGGTLVDADEWRNHGTAVLGVLVARAGERGMVGICRDATALVHSAYYGTGFNMARAIVSAGEVLEPGDILLLELQAKGPGGRYVAPQFWDDVYSAILSIVERGVVVVQAAGNGGIDFDDDELAGSNLQKDAGALVVGAGVPPTNFYDTARGYREIGEPRSRMPFSNRGRIVKLQSWGWHVATLGYGDAHAGARTSWYTFRFGGTSSAAPIVAGAAACLQGFARARLRAPLSPAELRRLLVDTGTRGPRGQNIGVQPDLRRAIQRLKKS